MVREGVDEDPGFRHAAPGSHVRESRAERSRQSHERWVVNKLRALGSWYTKGLHGGSQLRTSINAAESVAALRDIIDDFFFHRH